MEAYQQAHAQQPLAVSRIERQRRGPPIIWIVLGGLAVLGAGAVVLKSSQNTPSQAAPSTLPVAEAPPIQPPAAAEVRTEATPGLLGSFSEVVEAVRGATGCSGKITPGSDGLGPLFACIAGEAQTAKLFVNGRAEDPGARNIKVMWNQWTEDTGDGVSADRAVAAKSARAVAQRYAPELSDKVVAAFMSDEEGEAVFNAGGLTLTVAKSSGPSIREHLLTIEAGGG